MRQSGLSLLLLVLASAAPATLPATSPSSKAEEARKFWSFQPLTHPVPPPVTNEQWARTAIDRFVLAKQQEKGLTPNPPASREKLIRRAYSDLLGLPPAPADVSAFVNDASPDAYAKLIDRLLESPRYGERWARHWLDVARFAESDGFEHDSDRPAAFQYRDFVIRALNQDMPFDQFVQWQLAGDELAPDDWQAMAATGFLSAGVLPTQITEKEFEFTRYSQLDDMVSTVGNAMLGLTIGCARCHDHKFDPISCKDYYRLAASFATAIRNDVDIDVSTPSEREELKRQTEARQLAARAKIDAFEQNVVPAEFNAFVAGLRQKPGTPTAQWSVLDFEQVTTLHGTRLVRQPDGSLLKEGTTPDHETYVLKARTGAPAVTAIRLEALTDKSLPHNGPGAGGNGNFALTELELTAAPVDGSASAVSIKIASAIATHQQNTSSLSVASSFDGQSGTGWAVDFGGIGKDQAAIFRFEKPAGFAGGTLLTLTLHFDHASPQHLIGRPRISISNQPDPHEFKGNEGPDSAVADVLSRLVASQDVSAADLTLARRWYAASLPQYQQLKQELSKSEAVNAPHRTVKVQVTSEGLPPVKNFADDRGYPHFYKQVYLLRRGDPNNKVEPVSAAFPAILMRGGNDESHWSSPAPAGARTSFRRTALAHWITDTESGGGHLTARVIVNRLWQHHLGRGIVSTPNDFGVQGERPTHRELLDWLASDLVEHGWKLKRLHKLIMTSAVYMQDSAIRPEDEKIDPHDVYQWRWQPRRLEAEPIRDSMLAISGLLDESMYGPGTLDQDMRRRSVYFTVKRSQLVPMMMVLDWPEPLNSIGNRPSTTIAPQALLFLNSPQARRYAEAFSRRLTAAKPADAIVQAYEIALGRKPSDDELQTATSFLEGRARDAQNSAGVNAAVSDAAAMTDLCQALMSANEFVYVE